MDHPLAGKTVAILVANGFEELEMTEPQRALLGAGATLKLVSPEQGLVNGWHGKAWGHYFPIDTQISEALAADFDALLVPGGKRGIEKLAQNPHTKRLLKGRSEEHTSEHQSLMRISYAVFCLTHKQTKQT